MDIQGSVALVTGANRGLGRAFVERLLDAGAAKVYAAARHPASVKTNGASPVRLDVTAPADIDAAARECDDVTLVINNAGMATSTAAHCGFLDTDMAASIDAPKLAPESVVEQVLSALREGRPEVLADDITARVRAGLSGNLAGVYPGLVAS
jgi:NADP-dependent 3-hydroxy acid dehydrogenase YdfG